MIVLPFLLITHAVAARWYADADAPGEYIDLVPDAEYCVEVGETAWFKLTAPARYCYLSELPLRKIGDYYYGSDVLNHTLYDKEMNDPGIVTSSNDPDSGGWNELVPGETYYLKVTPYKSAVRFNFSPVKEEPTADPAAARKAGVPSLALTAEKVEKTVPGEVNSVWDVYTVSEKITVSDGYVYSSDMFAAPYHVAFGNAELIPEKGTATYASVERTAGESRLELASYTEKPAYPDKAPLRKGEYVYSANFCGYLTGVGEDAVDAELRYEVYVPPAKSRRSQRAASSMRSTPTIYSRTYRIRRGIRTRYCGAPRTD